jgi:hypothetical protein
LEDIEKWSLGSTPIDFREFSVEIEAVSPNLLEICIWKLCSGKNHG